MKTRFVFSLKRKPVSKKETYSREGMSKMHISSVTEKLMFLKIRRLKACMHTHTLCASLPGYTQSAKMHDKGMPRD